MEELTKKDLIEEIKLLITSDGSSVDINPNYLEYFMEEELEEIKNELLIKKENTNKSTKEYVNELYEKLAL